MAHGEGLPKWCLIESDPAVFTELIRGVGVKGLQVEEVLSLDPTAFAEFTYAHHVYGLIFLFGWQGEAGRVACHGQDTVAFDYPRDLFFAKQVIPNACATQALVSVLLNAPKADHITLGEPLDQLKAFAEQLDASMRGLAISNSLALLEAHNSFRPETGLDVEEDDKAAGDPETLFHYAAYVPFYDTVYELDGLKPGPIAVGSCGVTSWLDVARQAIAEKIDRLQGVSTKEENNLKFSLLAVVSDPLMVLERRLKSLRHLDHRLRIKLFSFGEEVGELDDALDDDDAPEDVESLDALPDTVAEVKQVAGLRALERARSAWSKSRF